MRHPIRPIYSPRRVAAPLLALALLGASLPLATSRARAEGAPGGRAHALGLAQADGPRVVPRVVPHRAAGAVLAGVAADVSSASSEGAPAAGNGAASPASVDISRYSPPVADQGDINSCVAWVTTYYMRGWYARRDGYYPGGGADGAGSFAPMYLYSQLTNGQNAPTSFAQTLDLQVAQGIDTRADYAQGDKDYTNGPTAAERASAASYKISGYAVLFQGANQGDAARAAIEASIAGGDPVGLGIPVYDNFWNADAGHSYVDGAPGASYGNHAVFATRYDANGLWVENQWGTGWGQGGWVELSWSFVDQYAWEAVTIHPLAGSASPGATTTLAATPAVPVATAMSLPAATATATARPQAQGTAVAVASTATAVGQAASSPPAGGDPLPAQDGHGTTSTVSPTPNTNAKTAPTMVTRPTVAAPTRPAHGVVTIPAHGRTPHRAKTAHGPHPRATGTVAHSAHPGKGGIAIGRRRGRAAQGRIAARGGHAFAAERRRAGESRAAGCARRLYVRVVRA